MKKTILYILIALMSMPLAMVGQTRKFFSTDNGLSNSLINQIYQDKRGFIWIATEYGLNRFDGIKFEIYRHDENDPASLCHNYVRTLFEDSSSRFYIGTFYGLMQYLPETDSFRNIRMIKEDKAVYPHVTSIIELHTGDLLLATSGQGIFSCKKGEEHFDYEAELTNSLSSIYLNSLYEDSRQRIWIGSENDGLNCYQPAGNKTTIYKAPQDISSNNISAFEEDELGNIYVGTLTRGLNRLRPEKTEFEHIPYNQGSQLFIKSLIINEEDQMLIGTDGQGMKAYNAEKNMIEDYDISSVPFNFANGKIHSILIDKEKNTWLGFFQKGVFFIPTSENRFDYFGFKSGNDNPIGSNSVTAIYKDSQGITWIGTDNDGIYGLNDQGKRLFHYHKTGSPSSVPDIIHSIYEDSRGNMWLGSYTDGLSKFNRTNGNTRYIPGFTNEKVYCITPDNPDNILVGTYGSGFFLVDSEGNIKEHHESSKRELDLLTVDELSNDWINTLLCDKDGLIWIGHFKGLSCFDPVKKTFLNYFSKNNILPGTVVQYLYEDRKGIIWIGTSSGLYSFDKQTEEIKQFTVRDGLPNEVICAITSDNEGNLWISTYEGISKYKAAENRFINYYAADGLQGNEFSRGAVFKDKTGKLYFGGINGFNAFYPQNIVEERKELEITLTNFYLFNKPVRKGDRSDKKEIVDVAVMDADVFHLAHDDNTFSFEFSTFDFSNPERISFQYRMENLNTEWMATPPGINRVTYNNLPPGKYYFHVRAFDNDNFSPVKSLEVVISPPWYKSQWAYFGYLLLFILALYLIVNFIISKIRHREELMQMDHAEKISEAKLQFFINISHEIRTPMTLIINPLEKLINDNRDKDPDKQKIYLMIYRNAQRILRLINQLMDIRKLDKGQMKLRCRETDMVGFIQDLMMTFEYSARKKNIDFVFEHEDESLFVWVDLNNFDKVLLNIFSNAFKYTPDNGEIKVSLSTGYDPAAEAHLQDYFEIVISDSGIGIDRDEIEKIFERFYQINNDATNSNFGTGIGLHLSRSLVELHGGVIFAENRGDAPGSRFVIRLPMGKDHLKAENLEQPDQKTVFTENPSPTPVLTFSEESEITAGNNKSVRTKTKYTVLIVEDEEEIRQYVQEELAADYKILSASNGKEALDIILRNKPDLVVSDVMMPEMDGITLSRKMKQNININHIPIILLTAKSKTEDKLEGLEIGADAYIVKPFNTEILKQTINNLIANRERLKNKFSGHQQPEDKIEKIEIKSSDEKLMERIMKVINENIANPHLNVEMLAENAGMSRVHLHRKLKELTNQSARDFIRGIRLKQAATLLSEKKLSVSEAAYATGFSNLSHFSNSFKEFYGVSPTEYANNIKE